MDWKLFASTFGLIFLAELGDKTQLAAFAASAGSRSPWSVFYGAACALVLSTLLAVLLGDTIQKFVPQSYLKVGAGSLFIVFGILLLVSVFVRAPSAAVAAPAPTAAVMPTSGIARMVLSMARDFEEAATMDYRAMAAGTQDPQLRALLNTLADEEQGHLRAINDSLTHHGDHSWETHAVTPMAAERPDAGSISQATMTVLDQAIAHENAKARFYASLADTAPAASLKTVLRALASDEAGHAQRLSAFAQAARGN
jgi:rubrerythrin